jgi:hypothetical protein
MIAKLFGSKTLRDSKSLAGSTSKKVIVSRRDREPVAGFVNPRTYLQPGGVEVLSTSGQIVLLPYPEVEAVCFVRDFDAGESWRQHRSFQARPRSPGLWLRLVFRNGEQLEGLAANNLLLLEPYGVAITPNDPTFMNQKIFVPRAALLDCQVLGVIGSPLRKAAKAAATDKADQRQLPMFES